MGLGIKFRLIPRGLFRSWHLRKPKNLHDPYRSYARQKEDRYGDDRTIHHNNTVDVEIGPTGEVCAVWFRCRMLPFTQHDVRDSRVKSMLESPPDSLPGIKAIVFEKDFPYDDISH